jgi:hypothetical protein
VDLNEHLIKDATSTRSAEAKALGIGMGVPWLTLHRHRRTRHRRCQGHRPDYRPRKRLNALGINTTADLRAADPVLIRDRFSVVVQRIVLELRGIPCVQLETERADKKQLIFSRSFAAPVAGTSRMREVLGVYAQQAAIRLVKDGLHAGILTSFAGTSEFRDGAKSFPSATVKMPARRPTPSCLARPPSPPCCPASKRASRTPRQESS